MSKPMTNLKASETLSDCKIYANSHSLDAIEYAIDVLKKLEEAGIHFPLKSLTPSTETPKEK